MKMIVRAVNPGGPDIVGAVDWPRQTYFDLADRLEKAGVVLGLPPTVILDLKRDGFSHDTQSRDPGTPFGHVKIVIRCRTSRGEAMFSADWHGAMFRDLAAGIRSGASVLGESGPCMVLTMTKEGLALDPVEPGRLGIHPEAVH